jgi:uncharacterized protein (TIGR03083 family)
MQDTETRGARQALLAAAKRSAELIGSIDDMDLPIPRSEWNVGDAAAHLIFVLRGFTGSAKHEFEEWQEVGVRLPARAPTAERVAALNRIMIPAEPTRSPKSAARALAEAVEGFLAATADLPPSGTIETPWYGDGQSISVAAATCLLLGEQVIHGYDIAQAAHRKWPIAKTDALLILTAVQVMIPKMAKSEALGNARITYRIHPGGKADFVVLCADGAITVEEPRSQRVDCHIAADPAAFLLLGYGRITQWRAIAGAKMITWGRRPWLAFRFVSFISHP